MADQTSDTRKATEELGSQLESCLQDLSITNKKLQNDVPRPITKKGPTKPKKDAVPVADSWEDELGSSGSETEKEEADTSTPVTPSAEGPLAPPPTPISPQTGAAWTATGDTPYTDAVPSSGSGHRSPGPPRVRPAKQTAVAARLIAGGLGIRAPKRTEEQRAYDRAIREQEVKRRNREKEEAARAKEEEERAKAAVWDA
ncbi:conserved hypothetical protein [Paecilomyces variotii No. 5]|uniref:Uncharacterized protein n=1 Tax=Byssochlamys spectabilis (strain No. 5 / NBRC 109023) TaxID=1356009 RepID=V5G2P0_BYSSN|nr:conserved hypothetical protein [Paecilomyces variotii No. 5]